MTVSNPFSLAGKTALINGASRGIGLAIAQSMAHAGAHTILAARSLPQLTAAAKDLCAQGCQAEALRLDMADETTIEQAAAALPAIDILVNVAGTNIRKQFTAYTRDEYNYLLQTNLHGIVRLTQLVGEKMVQCGNGGKVIHIGSLMSLLGLPLLTVYAITKSGLAGLTRTLAAEWGRHNIQVNCIAPGFIITDLNRKMWESEKMKQWLLSSQASQRLGKPEDIAPVAVFLASAASDYVTGQVIAVDGGYTTTANWPFEG